MLLTAAIAVASALLEMHKWGRHITTIDYLLIELYKAWSSEVAEAETNKVGHKSILMNSIHHYQTAIQICNAAIALNGENLTWLSRKLTAENELAILQPLDRHYSAGIDLAP